MKHFFIALTMLLSAPASHALTVNAPIVTFDGTLEFRVTSDVTCMAIGCPPPQRYLQAMLNVPSVGRVALLPVRFPAMFGHEPADYRYGNLKLTEGMALRVTGQYFEDGKFMSSVSSLRPLPGGLSVVLEISKTQIQYTHGGSYQAPGWKLSVLADGRVVKTTYMGQQQVSSEIVQRLPVQEAQRLMNEVQRSAGHIQPPDLTQAVCMAMPSHNVKISGLNGQVLLWEAAVPCGHVTKNISRPGTSLIAYANSLVQRLGLQ